MRCRPWVRDGRVIGVLCGVRKEDQGRPFGADAEPKPSTCHVCGQPAGLLCDFPVGEGRTCDRAMCLRHYVPISSGIDYCTEHAGAG